MNARQYNGRLNRSGQATWSPDQVGGGSPTELKKGEYVIVQMLEGPEDVTFVKVTFEDKNTRAIQSTWRFDDATNRWTVSGNQPNDFRVEVGRDGETGVSPKPGRKGKAIKITDNQDVGESDPPKHHEMRVYFNSASQPGGPWCLDPEIINKGGK